MLRLIAAVLPPCALRGSLLGFIGLIVALPLTTLIIAYWQRYITKEQRLPQEAMANKPEEVQASVEKSKTSDEKGENNAE